jgi:hypothetical protein
LAAVTRIFRIIFSRGVRVKMNNVQDIIDTIKKLENDLLEEIQKKEEEFSYTIEGKRVFFAEETRRYHKILATRLSAYILDASFLHILTAPFIWFCIFPALFLDLVVSIFQSICFRVYGIPTVKRSDYIIMDRQSLSYLNLIERINCVYCGYFIGLIAFVQEISARTEQFWCPIKHARKLNSIHRRYHKFLEFGDPRNYQERLIVLRKDFNDLEENGPPEKPRPE